jgi:diguanylate cyclase (GGDEF)-like protein
MKTAIAREPGEAIELIATHRPDLLLLDMYMPRVSGADLATVIRQQPAYASLPIVFLSSEHDPDKQLAAIVRGADDFLEKPIRPDRLISSVTARAERLRFLRGMMTQDPMTKLLNHIATKEKLADEIERAKRSREPISFALLDIDRFKTVNDTYGHPVGDTVIRGLARLLRQRLRHSDAVGRYGGEEFAVIMPDTDIKTAVSVLDELRAAFERVAFFAGETRFTSTFSCGIAAIGAEALPSGAIAAADAALYVAKNAGRNCIRTGRTDGA